MCLIRCVVPQLPVKLIGPVLNVEANVEVDITALDAVESLRAELDQRGIVFALARVKQDLHDALDAYGLTASIGVECLFPTLPTAVEAYQASRPGPAPQRDHTADEPRSE